MIEAYFTTQSAVTVPCLIPDRTIMQHAEMAGMTAQDLFSLDIPAGASRESKMRCLIKRADINRLYASFTSQGTVSATLNWRENSAATLQQMTVFLLPPKPVFVQAAGGLGVVQVDAVDCRYWWKRVAADKWSNLNIYPVVSRRFTHNARQYEDIGSSAVVETLKNLLPVGTIDLTQLTTYSGTFSQNRITRMFNGATSLAMLIDLFLGSMGFCVVWDGTNASRYVAQRIGSDLATLNALMNDSKRALCGGLEPSSTVYAPSDPLLDYWDAVDNAMKNRSSTTLSVHFPFRAPEGFTTYDNTLSVINQGVPFDLSRESGTSGLLPTTLSRPRQPIGSQHLVESFPMTANNTSTPPDPFNPAASAISSGIGYTGWVQEAEKYASQLDLRQKVAFGRTVWSGWVQMPAGSYRATMLRYTIGFDPNRESSDDYTLVPYTYTEAREDDWILGPSGDLPSDPSLVAVGNGIIHASRLSTGELWIDAPPPMCRVFPARITGSTRIGASGDDYWRWTYAWQEVEPNAGLGWTSTAPFQTMGGYDRNSAASGVARNLAEQGNNYVADSDPANVIATGAVQADYLPTAKIEPYPISNDTVVLMVEQNSSVQIEGGGTTRFWFSIPNAIKTTCIEQPAVDQIIEGGFFDGNP